MKYNFDEIIDRRGTDSLKWDEMSMFGTQTAELLPMWIADMDFRTPPFVIEALKKRLEHEVLGYTKSCESWSRAVRNWCRTRYDWNFGEDKLVFIPGIVRGLAAAVRCLTSRGDKVMITSPVYHPFSLVTQNTGRTLVSCPLQEVNNRYEIDFNAFEKAVQGCKIFILCNPHNPGGRVWSREELRKIADLCAAAGTVVVSDEIHADLTLSPRKHCTFNTVSETARLNSIVFMAPSKTFNMAGLASSFGVVENDELRRRFFSYLEAGELSHGHMFAYIGAAAAYSHGTEWLDEMLAYIQTNIDFTEEFLSSRLPRLKMMRPEASFLIWLDCRAYNLSQEELVALFVDKARLALNNGEMFGNEGRGFMRLNIGCPRSVLKEALERLEQAFLSIESKV